jgi:hypothetical protein
VVQRKDEMLHDRPAPPQLHERDEDREERHHDDHERLRLRGRHRVEDRPILVQCRLAIGQALRDITFRNG